MRLASGSTADAISGTSWLGPLASLSGVVRPLLWVLLGLAVLALLDRVLLRLESRGWINYRRRGLSRSGAAFHALTLQSIVHPSAQQLSEVRYQHVEERDDSGDPPPPSDEDTDLAGPSGT
ncbi:MAG: hypothetical protein OEO20_16780 [Gemmatimonadota bacterium]|nr:hypothetical protein [Gemmatimonadota bacterium]MDH3479952.1 hypothetical protein [Gemmatimonadota bacterium]MDH5551100.1 hypothetical protein [Gemmatimonadota bacterium]